ncbi:MAG TPA: LacI family DNA-binding transcriptional regulator [Chitinophagaceae bacterium]|nr:LacI family DNA-binding transcriptional regulator [Chitinophagaceae bacterium]
MKRISIRDLAKKAGVSTSTVSFILNGKAEKMRISKELTAKVKDISKKMGYVPNQVAVSLRTGQSKQIGLIVESISGHFFGLLARIIETEAEKYGYRIIYCSTENKAQQGLDILKMLSQQQVDGYMITPAKGMEEEIRRLAERKKPVVLIDGFFEGDTIPYVIVDNYKGVEMGMKHLFAKGYKDIGFVTVDLDLVQIAERKAAFTDALKNNKIRKIGERILTVSYHSPAENIMQQIKDFITGRPKMDAIFFSTNYLGVLGVEIIAKMGLALPGDLAMICFDDQDVFRLFGPGITVIKQPVDEIARKAIDLLLHQLEKKKSPGRLQQVKLQPVLVERGST